MKQLSGQGTTGYHPTCLVNTNNQVVSRLCQRNLERLPEEATGTGLQRLARSEQVGQWGLGEVCPAEKQKEQRAMTKGIRSSQSQMGGHLQLQGSQHFYPRDDGGYKSPQSPRTTNPCLCPSAILTEGGIKDIEREPS